MSNFRLWFSFPPRPHPSSQQPRRPRDPWSKLPRCCSSFQRPGWARPSRLNHPGPGWWRERLFRSFCCSVVGIVMRGSRLLPLLPGLLERPCFFEKCTFFSHYYYNFFLINILAMPVNVRFELTFDVQITQLASVKKPKVRRLPWKGVCLVFVGWKVGIKLILFRVNYLFKESGSCVYGAVKF